MFARYLPRTLAMLLLCVAFPVTAQVLVSSDFLRSAEGSVTLRILEEKTNAPVAYASVYLTAKNDTLITNFTLTDTTGTATLAKVARGTYLLTVEMLGYKTYRKEYYFTKEKEDLGLIRLPDDVEMLDAARVTAIGNPVEIRQDTVIFNASSFQLGQNQMLEDLLRRMPGMEVGSDGSVKYNGETIQKITVGGKTFFFDDPKMALRNLPARVVDKVKVIDKVSDSEQFTGVAANREKVMDLEFKKEFQEGWFGNAKASAGATLNSEEKNPLNDNRGLLYNGSLLLSGYNPKDQLTLIGNAYNAPLMGRSDAILSVAYTDDDGDVTSSYTTGGLLTDSQAGLNYNTTRIKGLESTAMARYDHSFRDSRSFSRRTTFGSGDDLLSESDFVLSERTEDVKINLELKNTTRKKILFQFTPTLRYRRVRSDQQEESRSESSGQWRNSAAAASSSLSGQFRHEADLAFGLRNLGNSRRSLTLNASYNRTEYDADSRDSTVTRVVETADPFTRDLRYEIGNRSFGSSAGLTYVEPLAKGWVLSASLSGNWSRRDNRKEATDMQTHARDAYLSTALLSRYDYYIGNLRFQYRKGTTSFQFGARAQETLHELHSVSRGIETLSGKDDWIFDWSPYLIFRCFKEQLHLTVSYLGNTIRPSAVNLLPTLNLTVPARLRTGNIYLKPSNSQFFSVDLSWSIPQRQISLSAMNTGRLFTRQTVTASWFDENGIQYGIPVNAAEPGYEYTLYSYFNAPLSGDKRLTINLNLNLRAGQSVSYQNIRRIEGFDAGNFDYTAFMADFWGDSEGDRFYSGTSGFSKSRTRTLALGPEVKLSYRGDRITATLWAGADYNRSRYALDPKADTDTWYNRIGAYVMGQLPYGFELSSRGGYHFFSGYPEGYDAPYLKWDVAVARTIRQFTFELQVNDILGSSRAMRHIATANYVEDLLQNQLGRYFFVQVKWNFGKLNESHSARANQAVWDMMY